MNHKNSVYTVEQKVKLIIVFSVEQKIGKAVKFSCCTIVYISTAATTAADIVDDDDSDFDYVRQLVTSKRSKTDGQKMWWLVNLLRIRKKTCKILPFFSIFFLDDHISKILMRRKKINRRIRRRQRRRRSNGQRNRLDTW